MGVITFNGTASDTLGILVEVPPGYETPERDYDITHVPGRNGDVVIDTGSYQNVDRSYMVAVGAWDGDFVALTNVISEWLHSASGYARLEDSYEPDYYRMAIYKEGMDVTNIYTHAGRVTITFNCKPQRFLVSGEEAVTFTSSGTLTNPTNFTALPIITVKISECDSGVLSVAGYTISIAASTTSTDYLPDSDDDYLLDSDGNYIQATSILDLVIDCDLQDAYSGTTNENSLITLSSGAFPELSSGKNSVSFSGGITAVEIVPNWWTL